MMSSEVAAVQQDSQPQLLRSNRQAVIASRPCNRARSSSLYDICNHLIFSKAVLRKLMRSFVRTVTTS